MSKTNLLLKGSPDMSLWQKFRRTCYENSHLILAFLLPVALLWASYICFGVYPFGEKSVLALDLNGQYVYYYDYMHDVFGNGESLFYSWSRNLSGEFMGIIGYYLASPFNLLVYLFPREMITEGLLTMLLAKAGAMGFSMAFYLDRSKHCKKLTCVAFAPLYSLCAYSIVQTMNPMWLDGVFILPLVCYGIERLIDRGRFKMLVFTLIYAFVTNFYIGYMIGIFSAIYFVYYMVASGQFKKGNLYPFLAKTGTFALSAVSAVLASCFMILPVYKSLQNGKFTFSNPDYSLAANFDLAQLAQKLFPNSYDTVRMIGLPMLYCGTIALILVPLYFICKKFPLIERLSGGILLGVMALCMYIRPVDMLWHGGQMPNWLPQRYSFMISFLLLVFAAKAFDNLKYIKAKWIGFVTVAVLGVLLYIESLDTLVKDLGSSGREVFDSTSVVLPAIIILVAMAFIVYFVKKNSKKGISLTAGIVIVALISGEVAYNCTNTIFKINTDILYSTRDSYLSVILPAREVVEGIKAEDDGFYRIEKNFFRTTNDPLALNMYGLSHSSSTLNGRPINLLDQLGFTSRGHYTRYSGATPLTSDIFGVKYIMNTENNRTSDIGDASDITVEKNENALPLVYLVDNKLEQLSFVTNQPFTNQNEMLSNMLGETGTMYFQSFKPEGDVMLKNVTEGKASGNHLSYKVITEGSAASVTFNLTAPKDGHVYMYLPTSYERAVNLYINGSFLTTYFEADNHHIQDLGEFTKGQSIKLELKLTKSDLYFTEAQFMTLDEEKLNADIAKLQEKNENTTVEKISQTNIKITTNSDKDNLLLTTIPEEEGWTVYVDGKAVEYETVMADSLIATRLSAGEHVVELVYTAAGWYLGLLLTIVGLGILVIMIWFNRSMKKPIQLSTDKAIEDKETEDKAENESDNSDNEQNEVDSEAENKVDTEENSKG